MYTEIQQIQTPNMLFNEPKYLGYSTNNQYGDFPPMMSDGRAIVASYQPEAVANNALIDRFGIKSNWEYRKFLTENSALITKHNYIESGNDIGYYKRYADSATQGPPYSYRSYLEKNKPVGYSNSDLKDLYISREQLESRKTPAVITQDDLLKRGAKR
jgi:hypothetical protein